MDIGLDRDQCGFKLLDSLIRTDDVLVDLGKEVTVLFGQIIHQGVIAGIYRRHTITGIRWCEELEGILRSLYKASIVPLADVVHIDRQAVPCRIVLTAENEDFLSLLCSEMLDAGIPPECFKEFRNLFKILVNGIKDVRPVLLAIQLFEEKSILVLRYRCRQCCSLAFFSGNVRME